MRSTIESEDIMANENEGMAKGLIMGFLAGTVVGAVLGLLYAPKPGKELRADIKRKTDEFVGDAEEYIAKAKKRAGDLISEGRQKAENLVSDARKRAESLMEDAERILTDVRTKGPGDSKKS